MKNIRNRFFIAFAVSALFALAGLHFVGAVSADQPGNGGSRQISVSPNILASRDGNFYHAELMVAANPKNPRNLVAGAITPTAADGGPTTRAYTTYDSGYTWTESVFPDLVKSGGGDPQVAFSPHGTAYFASLALVKDEERRTRAALYFYRSEDGGTKWSGPVDLGYSYDHPQIVIDHTFGQYAGRIYIGVLYGREYSLGIFRSDDDGRTFTGPVKVLDGAGIGVNVSNMMVLSDGELVMTYGDFQLDPAKRKANRMSNAWVVKSKDGGITFSKPVKILSQHWSTSETGPAANLGGFSAYAIDEGSKDFKDRIYVACPDYINERSVLVFSYSSDAGETWSQPRPLDASAPPDSFQYQPSVAVNSAGAVGVLWFDSRGLNDVEHYNAYFAASTDGGKTFLPPVRLSSEPSYRFGRGNLAFSPFQGKFGKDDVRFAVVSAATRWSNGGDYMGLAADSKGVFHPFWTDARTGTFQAMTSEVRVAVPPVGSESEGQPKADAPVELEPATVTQMLDMDFDPNIYDDSTHEFDIPIRLKNTSSQPIYPPIIVKIIDFGSGMGDMYKDKKPLILNASNGKQDEGAEFDYTPALRDMKSLQPGAETEAITVRLKLKDPRAVPDVHFQITGSLAKSKN